MKLLWIDDLRNPFLNIEGTVPLESKHIEWVLNFDQFTQWIERFGLPDIISFDHDLADVYDNDRQEKTGMDCAKWLVDYCLNHQLNLPRHYVHSANPVGAKNISTLLDNFNKHNKSNMVNEDSKSISFPIGEQNDTLLSKLFQSIGDSQEIITTLKYNQSKMKRFEMAAALRDVEKRLIEISTALINFKK